jgi:DNA sulfur modification protein DndC
VARTKINTADQELTLDGAKLRAAIAEIQRIYLSLSLAWVIGVSSGKDSTAMLQLIWMAIRALPAEQRTRPIFVILGDTGGSETPQVRQRIYRTALLINHAAQEQGLPITAHIAEPAIIESILVVMIGKGYSPMTIRNRWCTERAKINPVSRLTQKLTKEHGGRVIQAIGSRKTESVTRGASIERHTIAGWHFPFQVNTALPGSYIYGPLRSWTTKDVWTLLELYDSPFGGEMYNMELAALYREADSNGECPLILDKSAPSCGNSRFGCWLCTVVDANGSLEALVGREDHQWMMPLYEVWQFLKLMTDPAQKARYRDDKYTMHGTIKPLTRDPWNPTPGKLKMATRHQLFAMVLEAQQRCREDGPDSDLTLLTTEELRAIRHLWIASEAEAQIRAEAMPFAVPFAVAQEHVEKRLALWYERPELMPVDMAREIVAGITGEELWPWAPNEAALLEKPRKAHQQSESEQLVMSFFGEEAK